MLNQHMNIVALDIGDVHTGIARCDALGMFATPYKTIPSKELLAWLVEFFTVHGDVPYTFVIGYPRTMRNTASEQTNKITALHQQLIARFPQTQWVLWDERLTSKEAKKIASKNIRLDKNYEHAVSAAIILQAYLEHVRFKQQHIDKTG